MRGMIICLCLSLFVTSAAKANPVVENGTTGATLLLQWNPVARHWQGGPYILTSTGAKFILSVNGTTNGTGTILQPCKIKYVIKGTVYYVELAP